MGVLLDCPIGRADPRICVGIAIAVLRNLRKCIPLLDAGILDLLLGRGVLPPHHLALAHLLDMPPPCTPPSASLRQRLPGWKVPPCPTADHRAPPGCCPPRMRRLNRCLDRLCSFLIMGEDFVPHAFDTIKKPHTSLPRCSYAHVRDCMAAKSKSHATSLFSRVPQRWRSRRHRRGEGERVAAAPAQPDPLGHSPCCVSF